MKKIILLSIILLAVPLVVFGAQWEQDPSDCNQTDASEYPGQSCVPIEICGDSSGTAQCYDTSSISYPAGNANSVYNWDSGTNGGYVINCYATSDASAPYCDNSGNWWCDLNSTCYTTNHKYTTCLAGGNTYQCGSCRSGWQDCDANATICEVQTGVTAQDNPNTVYAAACGYQCSSGYQACEGDSAGTEGCLYQTGVTTCTTGGGAPGTWEAGCTCTALTQEAFLTNTLAEGFGRFLLWGNQVDATGNFMNLYSSNTEAFFRIDYNGSTSSTGSAYFGGAAGVDPLVIGSSTAYLIVNENGNVGINTSAPTKKLHIVDTSAGAETIPLLLNNKSNTAGTTVSIGFAPHAGTTVTGKIGNAVQGSNDYDMVFSTWGGSLTEAMRIDKDGYLGVGTDDPKGELHIMREGGAGDNDVLQLTAGGTTSGVYGDGTGILFRHYYDGNYPTWEAARIMTHYRGSYAADLVFETNYGGGASNISEKMRIEDGGNVGIGDTAPDYKLQVNGDIAPSTNKGGDLGKTGLAWDDLYYDDAHNEGAAAFTDRAVTDEIINYPPVPKTSEMHDYKNERGLKELDPSSLPEDLWEGLAILTDELTTYNYKANYEQQLQINALKMEIAELKKLCL